MIKRYLLKFYDHLIKIKLYIERFFKKLQTIVTGTTFEIMILIINFIAEVVSPPRDTVHSMIQRSPEYVDLGKY